MGVEGAVVIRRYLENNGALVKLNLSNNRITEKEGGKLLSGMIAENSVLKELDISGNCKYDFDNGPGFAEELAVGLGTNGVLEKLTMGTNALKGAEAGKALSDAIAILH